jgi:hypothetical protein
MSASATARKRKPDTASGPAAKKACIAAGKGLVEKILADPEGYTLPTDEVEMRKLVIELAQYAREAELAPPLPKPKSPEELQAAVDRLQSTTARGIEKLMSVCSPSN